MAGLPTVPGKRSRDERLDLFRGLTMLIIFVAHLPANSWNAWIPARFGFSSGAELFVFCSGLASALAFGGVFTRRGLWLGTARIAYRIWQVYWAQIGLVLALIALAALLDRSFGLSVLAQQFPPLLADPERALLGLATLTWQPDYLDILPMYLVILALVPVMMLARRLHAALPFLIAIGLYVAVWGRGLNLPGNPWNDAGWFLNPFAWQLIFFIGFFIGMNWLPVPRLGDRRLMLAAALFVLLSVPLSFWGILEHWPLAQVARDLVIPASEKTDLHILRVLHFLALAYLVLSLIEPWRDRLDQGAGHLLILIGRQSLAAFLASVVLARLLGVVADMAGRSEPVVALLNLIGFALILAAAIAVGWFKSAPWSGPKPKLVAERPLEPAAGRALPTRVREAS
ncbi:MAG: OpgC domain-containing protein [Bosea sp.]|uniref:OpgC family protein n=1 Tax=Bosea sp. (in: a-proteobacteria) TaxID=1871050 RepID=UPI0023973068|nr:OpgC domain-containing protein [Bosea sp. (in: a-proteobacteria)]MCP4739778.1 OpgC domain-containing protein [Bosea sp. (in: a-proteobacteria)]